jgi:GntR family transcriptional regulator
VNPNTVQKAYRELEQQGYIYTKTGLGTFVCPRSEIRAEGPELERAEEEMAEAFKTFLRLGLGFEESEKKALEIFEIIRKESDEK